MGLGLLPVRRPELGPHTGRLDKGPRVLQRAAQYREQADFSTSIVFPAIAFEAEMARLYTKWLRIDDRDAMAATRNYGRALITEEELEEATGSCPFNIAKRIKHVSLYLDP